MVKQITVYSDKEILLSSKKKHMTDTYNKVNEFQKHNVASKKLDTKEYIQYNSIYIKIYR